MSKKYIEKEAAIRNICKGCGLFDIDNCVCTGSVRCDEYDAILDTPSANVKPVVMAGWIQVPANKIEISRGYIFVNKCSKCGHRHAPENDNFCSNCGADMRGECNVD